MFHNSIISAELTLREQILGREIYLKRLKTLQKRAEAVEEKLRSPSGRRFVEEVRRIHDKVLKEKKTASDELATITARHLGEIQAVEKTIERAGRELRESRELSGATSNDRAACRRITIEKGSVIKKGRRRISEIEALVRGMNSVRLTNRLQFRRRSLFLAYLHRSFIDRKESAVKGIQSMGLFDPKVARDDLRSQKVVYRKRSRVYGKMEKLEARREKMKGLVFKTRMRSLLKEKKKIDRARVKVEDRISRRMELCKNKLDRIENTAQVLNEELADMKTLGRIKDFFPSLVRVQTGKIRRAIKSAQKTLPVIQKIDKIYGSSPN